MNVIYEDNHILVVEKPCNVTSQADSTGDIDMITMCKEYLKEKYNKPGNVYVGLVHRLDRPVGGIMVFAKTSKAASRLSNSIRENEFKKEYLAVVNDNDLKDEDIFEDYLKKNEALNKTIVCEKNIFDAKYAKLSYNVVERKIVDDKKYALVKINLDTGRHHQIRVQFASRGCALYGDQRYGKSMPNTQIALWAYKISFKHPTKDEFISFECMPKKVGIWKCFSI